MMQILQFPIQERLSRSGTQERSEIQFEALQQAAETAQEEARAMRDELEALIVQMEKLRMQTIETEQENHQLRHTLLAAQRSCGDLKQEVSDLKDQQLTEALLTQELKTELSALQEENLKLQDQQTQLRHGLTESQTLCQSIQTAHAALKQSYQDAQEELKNAQESLLASHTQQERLEAKTATVLQDRHTLTMALSNLTEGFYELHEELLFAKQLLLEKTQISAHFFLTQEESILRIKQLEEELEAKKQSTHIQESTIEKLKHAHAELVKRLDEESIRANERAALLKKDYTQVVYQAQAAQEELARYRVLQERLLPLQHCFQTLSPLLQLSEKTAAAPAMASNTAAALHFNEGAWEEDHYVQTYRPNKNLFIET